MPQRRVSAIRHVAFEDLGLLAPALEAAGYELEILDPALDDLRAARRAEPDLLVVLGAPIGANQEGRYPFLRDELSWIEARLARGLPMLGVCLGAQLIARVLGARVAPGPAPEIGWAPIELTDAGRQSMLGEFASADHVVLHWHGDRFELPEGAERLACTELCETQAFRHGRNVLALQFHAEADPRRIESWLVGHACELGMLEGDAVSSIREAAGRVGDRYAAAAARAWRRWLEEIR